MGLVQKTIPLYNGVSQQPPTLRLESQSEVQENALCLLVDGLIKRPNSEHVKTLGAFPDVDKETLVHFIERDEHERYVVFITKDTQDPIKVYTLDGVRCTVDYTNKGYLTDSVRIPHVDLECVTVADYTFILNRNVVVESQVDPNRETTGNEYSGIIFVKRGLANVTYTVRVERDGEQLAEVSYTTPEVPEDATDPMFSTDDIANSLLDKLKDHVSLKDYSFSAEGSCVFINGNESILRDTVVKVSDSYGNQAISVAIGAVQKFTDLPPYALEGTIIEIIGDDGNTLGSYWVRYQKGIWREAARPTSDGVDLHDSLKATTMPHTLVRTGVNRFSFGPYEEWKPRLVGDEDSAPLPSFVNKTISDLFFFKNRLGFLSESNVILSEAGEFGNFFPNTVTDILDGDPIDINVASKKVVKLRHAVPLPSALLLFSDNQQFLLSGAGILSPVTVTVDHNSYHQIEPSCSPTSLGPSVFFVSPNGKYSSLREYYIQPDMTSNDAEDVTAHVPRYLPSRIKLLEAHISTNTLFLLPYEEDRLYVYSYYWEGEQKVQSAWGRWVLPSRTIIGLAPIGNWLYLLTRDDSEVYLERINLEHQLTYSTLNYRIHLDMMTIQDGVYDAGTNTTTWSLPYTTDGRELQVVDTESGLELNHVSKSGNKVSVPGNYSGLKCFIGVPYTLRYQFSRWYLRDEHGIAITQGKLQIRNLTLSYVDTGYFRLEVTNGKRKQEAEFTGATLGGLRLGNQTVQTGDKRFYIGGSADTVTITLVNDSYLPSKIQAASYEGYWVSRSRRF